MKKKGARGRMGSKVGFPKDAPSQGNVMGRCCKVALIAASYQVFSLGLELGSRQIGHEGDGKGKALLGKASSEISSFLVKPAEALCLCAHLCTSSFGRGGGCSCTGCTGCTGCTACTGCTGCTSATGSQEYNEFKRAYEAGRLSEAEAAIRRAIALRPTDQRYASLGLTLIRQGRYQEAEEALKKAKALAGGRMPDDIRDAYTALYFNKGNYLYNQRRYAEAEAAYRNALGFDPNDSAAYNNLGLALKSQKRYEEAIKAYEKALKIDGTYSHAKKNLESLKALLVSKKGDEFYRKKDYGAAETAYREAIKLDPSSAYVHRWLGSALFMQGRYADAEAAARKAITIDPNGVDAHNILGISLERQGRLGEAETELRRAMKLDPNFAWARNNLSSVLTKKGNSLYSQRRTSEAEMAFREAISLNRSASGASQGLALIEQKKGQERKAAEAKQKVIDAVEKLRGDLGSSRTPDPQGGMDSGATKGSHGGGLAFVDPGNNPANPQFNEPRAITFYVRGVPLTFGLGGAPGKSTQLESAVAGGERALEAIRVADPEDPRDPSGKLEEAKATSGAGFETQERAFRMDPLILRGQPSPEQRKFISAVMTVANSDAQFQEIMEARGNLIKEEQRLDAQLKEIREKRASAHDITEKNRLDMEEVNIKQQQSSLPSQIRIKELALQERLEVLSFTVEWPKQDKAPDQKHPVESQPSLAR